MNPSEGVLKGVEIMIDNILKDLIKVKIRLIKRKRMVSVCGVCCFSMKEFEYQLNRVMDRILGDDAKISI